MIFTKISSANKYELGRTCCWFQSWGWDPCHGTSWHHIWTSNAWRDGHFKSLRSPWITWGATEWYLWIWSLNDEMLIEAVNSINQESWMPWGQCWGQPNCFSAFWTSWRTWSTTITVTCTSRCYIQKCKSFQSSGWSTAPGNWAEPVQCINQEKHQMGLFVGVSVLHKNKSSAMFSKTWLLARKTYQLFLWLMQWLRWPYPAVVPSSDPPMIPGALTSNQSLNINWENTRFGVYSVFKD